MAPFSSLFDFVAHHRHHLSTDSSSSHSTFAVDSVNSGMKRPISEEVEETSSSSSSTSTCSSSSRKVCFFGSVKVLLIQSLDDYTDEEKAATWFCREEFDEMKRERRATIKLMERGYRGVDDGLHYFRGFESKTRQGIQYKQWNIMESHMAVFEQQTALQQQSSCQKEQAIARAYSAIAAHSITEAAQRGLQDQRAALESLILLTDGTDTTPRMPRRLSCQAAWKKTSRQKERWVDWIAYTLFYLLMYITSYKILARSYCYWYYQSHYVIRALSSILSLSHYSSSSLSFIPVGVYV